MKKFFSSDHALRLLSLLISIVLWFYLVVMLNPEIEMSIADIPVSYSSHQQLTQNNLVVMNETQRTVSIKVRANRGILANINRENVTAYVDLSDCTQAGSFSRPIHVRLPYEEATVSEKSVYNVNIVIDRLAKAQHKVSVQVTGNPKAEYAVFNTVTTQTLVEVTGAEEIIKTIDKAVIPIDVTDASDDIATLTEVRLLDSNGNDIAHKSLTIAPEKIEAHCTIFKQKAVPIKVVIGDTDTELNATITDKPEVIILGEDADLDAVSAIYTAPIEVPASSSAITVQAKIIVPPNIHLLEDVSDVTVEIQPIQPVQ